MWNCYDTVLQGQPRTTNSVEAWHGVFENTIAAHHTNIYKFIQHLAREEQKVHVDIQRFIAGQPAPKRKRKYVELDERITVIVKDYRNRTLNDYLSGLSFNFTLYSYSLRTNV